MLMALQNRFSRLKGRTTSDLRRLRKGQAEIVIERAINFFSKKIAVAWVIVPAIAWLCQFLFGTGAFWEWNRMPLVNLEIWRGLAELHQKKTAAIQDLLSPKTKSLDSDSDLWKAKVDYLNATERSLAHLEGRRPVVYGRPNGVLSDFRVE